MLPPLLTSQRQKLAPFLESYLSQQQQKFSDHFWANDFFARLKKYSAGGKMIRGSLVLALAELFGDPADTHLKENALKVATAMEMMNSALLMHDDILDQDELRRGQPAMHTQYQTWAKENQFPSPKHFGASMAICGGDIALGLCFSLLTDIEAPEKVTNQLQALFAQELVGVALAEAHDFEMAFTTRDISEQDILDMYRDKTGRYSIALPMMAGAILAEQDSQTIKTIEKIGENLGIIFQIKDDELGIFGDEKETGKPSGNDIREGKKTLWWYWVNQNNNDCVKYFGKDNITQSEIKHVKNIIQTKEISKKITSKIDELNQQIQIQIKQLNVSRKFSAFFHSFLKYSLNRKQ